MRVSGDSPEVFKQSFPSLQNLRISAQPAIRFRIREFWRPFFCLLFLSLFSALLFLSLFSALLFLSLFEHSFLTPFLSPPFPPIPFLALFFNKKPIFIL